MILNPKHIRIGYEWVKNYFYKYFINKPSTKMLQHHGIKGQKWGVRNGPPYPLDKRKNNDIIVKSGHKGLSKISIPNSKVDKVDNNGKVVKRAIYDSDGWKKAEIHMTNHGNPKHHPYGKNGEHIHYYKWDKETGKLLSNETREISLKIRKENEDIL